MFKPGDVEAWSGNGRLPTVGEEDDQQQVGTEKDYVPADMVENLSGACPEKSLLG